jgi:hypothetical protein
MASQLTHYHVLGIEPSASAAEIRLAYETKSSLLAPSMTSGAPSKVVGVVDRARAALASAQRTLLDPAARQRYDIDIGILQPGTGLVDPVPVPSEGSWSRTPVGGRAGIYQADVLVEGLGAIADWLAPRQALPRNVAVPDVRGLFIAGARRLLVAGGLHCEVSQLTQNAMPVEGLVVDQSPQPGVKAHRSSTVLVQVWHPARRPSQRS